MPKEIINKREKVGFFKNIDEFFDFKNKQLQKILLGNKFINSFLNIKKFKAMLINEKKNKSRVPLNFWCNKFGFIFKKIQKIRQICLNLLKILFENYHRPSAKILHFFIFFKKFLFNKNTNIFSERILLLKSPPNSMIYYNSIGRIINLFLNVIYIIFK